MNRKSSPSNNIMRIIGALVFVAILAINASGEPALQRLMIPIIVVLVIGMSLARMVSGLFSGGSTSSTSMSGGGSRLAGLLVALGVAVAGVAFFVFSSGGSSSPAFRELLRWAPLAGAFDALRQWGALLIIGGVVAVVGAVALIFVLRRSSELPGGSSEPWDPDKLS